jgi:hypothetical protein
MRDNIATGCVGSTFKKQIQETNSLDFFCKKLIPFLISEELLKFIPLKKNLDYSY